MVQCMGQPSLPKNEKRIHVSDKHMRAGWLAVPLAKEEKVYSTSTRKRERVVALCRLSPETVFAYRFNLYTRQRSRPPFRIAWSSYAASIVEPPAKCGNSCGAPGTEKWIDYRRNSTLAFCVDGTRHFRFNTLARARFLYVRHTIAVHSNMNISCYTTVCVCPTVGASPISIRPQINPFLFLKYCTGVNGSFALCVWYLLNYCTLHDTDRKYTSKQSSDGKMKRIIKDTFRVRPSERRNKTPFRSKSKYTKITVSASLTKCFVRACSNEMLLL